MLSRRRLLLATAASALGAAACSSGRSDGSADDVTSDDAAASGFEAMFADFEPSDEPNGDLSQVVWPDYVIDARPEVQRLYEFQIGHGELMRYMPCFCGCGNDGHRNNRDCYVRSVNPDGSVVFDSMAPT